MRSVVCSKTYKVSPVIKDYLLDVIFIQFRQKCITEHVCPLAPLRGQGGACCTTL